MIPVPASVLKSYYGKPILCIVELPFERCSIVGLLL